MNEVAKVKERTRFLYGNSPMIVTIRTQTRDLTRVCFPATLRNNQRMQQYKSNTMCSSPGSIPRVPLARHFRAQCLVAILPGSRLLRGRRQEQVLAAVYSLLPQTPLLHYHFRGLCSQNRVVSLYHNLPGDVLC